MASPESGSAEPATAHMSVVSGRLTRGNSVDEGAVRTSALCLDSNSQPEDAEATAAFERSVADVVRELVPHFHDIAPHTTDDLALQYFKQGITNKLVCVAPRSAPDDDSKKCLVRVFGSKTEFVIDRAHEMIVLTEHPMAPRVYGRFANGYVVEYSPGHTVTLAELQQPHISALVARATRQLHSYPMRGVSHEPSLYTTMRVWLGNLSPHILADMGAADTQALLDDVGGWEALSREVDWHESQIAALHGLPEPCLCHNDLLLGNILYDSARDKVTFIDFEYCSYSHAAHDIANHFCEWAGFGCAWEQYPTIEQQAHWLREYLGPERATDKEVAHWLHMVRWFELSSHLFWGIWAFLQGALSTIDFPYVPYANKRLHRYYERKKLLLSVEPVPGDTPSPKL